MPSAWTPAKDLIAHRAFDVQARAPRRGLADAASDGRLDAAAGASRLLLGQAF